MCLHLRFHPHPNLSPSRGEGIYRGPLTLRERELKEGEGTLMTGRGTDGKLAMTGWGISIMIDKVCGGGAAVCGVLAA